MEQQTAIREQVSPVDEATAALIEEHVRHLLGIMNFQEATARCGIEKDGLQLRIAIDAGEDGKLLIGAHGRHLVALEHIVRCVLRGTLSRDVRVIVDVNQYRVRREQTLVRLAEETARQAHRNGRAVVLNPMSASDRRAVHTALANRKDVQTESIGDDPERRVIVRPVFL